MTDYNSDPVWYELRMQLRHIGMFFSLGTRSAELLARTHHLTCAVMHGQQLARLVGSQEKAEALLVNHLMSAGVTTATLHLSGPMTPGTFARIVSAFCGTNVDPAYTIMLIHHCLLHEHIDGTVRDARWFLERYLGNPPPPRAAPEEGEAADDDRNAVPRLDRPVV